MTLRTPGRMYRARPSNRMIITAVANQKGGVGKTTTAVNLAACLAEAGTHVLLVDLDPQANATSALGVENADGRSIYAPLLGHDRIENQIVTSTVERLLLIPANIDLAGAEIEVARLDDHLTRLRSTLRPLAASTGFDHLILDCPPSLGILMTNALAAAHELLVPIQCEYFALEGLSKISQVIDQITGCGANPELRLAGIVMTMFDGRTRLSQQVVEEVRKHFGDRVYETVIPRTIRLGEAPSFGQPITQYETGGPGAAAYRRLAAEFLERHARSA